MIRFKDEYQGQILNIRIPNLYKTVTVNTNKDYGQPQMEKMSKMPALAHLFEDTVTPRKYEAVENTAPVVLTSPDLSLVHDSEETLEKTEVVDKPAPRKRKRK